MRKILALAMLCALPSAALSYTDVDGSVAKIPAAQQKLLDQVLDMLLFDGPSARIRGFKVGPADRACGFINAKGLSGGYVGYQIFHTQFGDFGIRLVGGKRPIGDIDPNVDADEAFCRSIGVP